MDTSRVSPSATLTRYLPTGTSNSKLPFASVSPLQPGTLLADPSVDQFAQAFQALRNSIRTGREIGGRVEVIFYYSGHADEQGLMLGVGRFPYERIRDEIGLLKADVNLAILDACASGAITRVKGGVRYPAFLANSAANMRGYAFLTSSSDNETAQESDRIQASFFTYYLISALRGAADSSGDGRVSLNEAYEFSYNETLGRTAKTQGGPQHPAYDIQMAGTGELIITDVRGVSSILVLPEDLSGRLYVMNSQKQLVAELFKPAGRKTELGLDAGTYHVYLQTDSLFLAASLKLKENETVTLERQLFIPAKKEPSILRGPSVYTAYESLLANRSRLEVLANPNGGDWGAAYSYGLREDLSLRLSAVRLGQDFDPSRPYFDGPSSAVTYKVLFGARYYPFKDTGNRVRPFLQVLGPKLASGQRDGYRHPWVPFPDGTARSWRVQEVPSGDGTPRVAVTSSGFLGSIGWTAERSANRAKEVTAEGDGRWERRRLACTGAAGVS
ncbi:MAG: hypothetical protein EHM23_35415, partial [Acidobacteria bacterium]